MTLAVINSPDKFEFKNGTDTPIDTTVEIHSNKKELAQKMILSLLSGGAKPGVEVFEIVKNASIGESTINAAKHEALVE